MQYMTKSDKEKISYPPYQKKKDIISTFNSSTTFHLFTKYINNLVDDSLFQLAKIEQYFLIIKGMKRTMNFSRDNKCQIDQSWN